MAPFTFIAALAALLCVSVAYKPGSLPVLALCDKSPTRCIRGARCVGHLGRRRCMRPVALGALCARNPYRYCSHGQKCWNGRCTKTVGLNGICRGKYVRCLTGLVCRRWRCVRPSPFVRPGDRCHPSSTKCVRGYSCVSTRWFKQCLSVVGLNGICGGKYVRCRGGLICRGWRCVRPRPYIRPGRRCSPFSERCSPGFSCVGQHGLKRCKKLMGLGQSCKDPWWVCRRGLTCVRWGRRAICIQTVGAGRICNGITIKCTRGYSCTGLHGRKRCVRRYRGPARDILKRH